MPTIDLLEQALNVAEQLGYQVRQECLGGSGGGICEVKQQKLLFVDLTANTVEQLQQVSEALQSDPGLFLLRLTPEMRRLFGIRRSA